MSSDNRQNSFCVCWVRPDLKRALFFCPSILALLATVCWGFFAGPAPDTVSKSALYLFTPTVTVLYSVAVHWGIHEFVDEKRYRKNPKTYFAHLVLCSSTLSLIATYSEFGILRAFVAELPPLSESNSGWQWYGATLASFVTLAVFGGVIGFIWLSAYGADIMKGPSKVNNESQCEAGPLAADHDVEANESDWETE